MKKDNLISNDNDNEAKGQYREIMQAKLDRLAVHKALARKHTQKRKILHNLLLKVSFDWKEKREVLTLRNTEILRVEFAKFGIIG